MATTVTRKDGALPHEGGPALVVVSAGEAPDAAVCEPVPSRTGSTLVFGALFALVSVYTVSLFLRANGNGWTWLDGWGVSSFELLSSVIVLSRAALGRAYRSFAVLLGIGMCFWSIGDYAMTYETLGNKTPATVSAANILWIGFYPFAYVAVMMLMRREAKKLDLASYLDGVMAALAVTALYVAFLFGFTVRHSGGDVVNAAINAVYPFGDLFLFALVALGLVFLPRGRRLRWRLMAVACLVNAAGDIAALFPGIVATRLGFVANADAWPVSLLLIALAVWLPPQLPAEELEEVKPSFTLPGLAAGSSLLIVLVASFHRIDRVGLALSGATLLTAGVRFGLTLRQLRVLTDERHRQLEEAARLEQASHEKLQATLRDLEQAAQAEQESRAALQTAMRSYSEFSDKAAEGARLQSAALADTSRTVEQVRITASSTAEQAAEVAERARTSLQVSDEGAQAVETIGGAMEEIRARVSEIAEDIVALSDRTQQIGTITQTVKGLAERSKLLALNASIEAARAGEHGKGFLVVAEEVRNLSDQSKVATEQVEKALAEIQDATDAAVTASTEGTTVVEKGLELTGRAGEVIRTLAETIREAAESVAQIATSSEQQREGIDEIATSVRNVNQAAEDLDALHRSLHEPQDAHALLAEAS